MPNFASKISMKDLVANDGFLSLPLKEQLLALRSYPEFSGLDSDQQSKFLTMVNTEKIRASAPGIPAPPLPRALGGTEGEMKLQFKTPYQPKPSPMDAVAKVGEAGMRAVAAPVEMMGGGMEDVERGGRRIATAPTLDEAAGGTADIVGGVGRMTAPIMAPAYVAAAPAAAVGMATRGAAGSFLARKAAEAADAGPGVTALAEQAGGAAAAVPGRPQRMAGEVVSRVAAKAPGAGKVKKAVSAIKEAYQGAKEATRPKAAPRPRQEPAWKSAKSAPVPPVPEAAPVRAELPSGRKPGPVPATPAPEKQPRKAPAWKDIQTSAKAAELPSEAAPKPAPELPSGRKPGKPGDEPPPPRVKGRAPRDTDEFYQVHGQARKAIVVAEDLHHQGFKAADLEKLTPEQRSKALGGKHSDSTYSRILFELRGLETGKIKPLSESALSRRVAAEAAKEAAKIKEQVAAKEGPAKAPKKD